MAATSFNSPCGMDAISSKQSSHCACDFSWAFHLITRLTDILLYCSMGELQTVVEPDKESCTARDFHTALVMLEREGVSSCPHSSWLGFRRAVSLILYDREVVGRSTYIVTLCFESFDHVYTAYFNHRYSGTRVEKFLPIQALPHWQKVLLI